MQITSIYLSLLLKNIVYKIVLRISLNILNFFKKIYKKKIPSKIYTFKKVFFTSIFGFAVKTKKSRLK